MDRIGMVTVGQSPRDDLVPAMEAVFSRHVQVLQAGALDGLGPEEIQELRPDDSEAGIVARLRDGGQTLLSHVKILPRVQQCVDRLAAEGVEVLVILCGGDWSFLRSDVLIVNPGRLFPAIISALALGWRLGVIKPSARQIEAARAQFASRGIDVTVAAASPYTGSQRLVDVQRAAEQLRDGGVDLVWMTCVGMDEPMRAIVSEVTGKPVVLARSILARVIDEFLLTGRVPARA